MDALSLGGLSQWVSSATERVVILWGEGFSRLAPEHQPTLAGMVLIGVLLLLAGRKLFWLALSAIGFLFGWQLAVHGLGTSVSVSAWAVGLLGGVVGLVVALTVRRLAAVLAGFAVGGLLGAKLLPLTPLAGSAWALALPLAFGLVGVALGVRLLDLALRVVTSGVGAALIVAAARLDGTLETILFVGLWALGFSLQRSRR